ncbi:MAG: HAMP domain-containing histidine kinase [Ruminococcaceae bacterium]|nr:HAMP domain-containing histidine kinase [Oscillospiraceae bacterium]
MTEKIKALLADIRKKMDRLRESAAGLSRNVLEWIDGIWHRLSRTLFTKYLFVTSAIIILAFIIFGTILASIVASRWQGERQQLLADNVSGIAQRAGNYIVAIVNEDGSTGDYQVSAAASTSLRASMAVMGQSLGCDLFLVDAQNNALLCAEEDSQTSAAAAAAQEGNPIICRHRGMLPVDFFNAAIDAAIRSSHNDYRATGDLGGIYEDDQYIVGVPIITKDAEGNSVVVGLAVAVSTASSIKEFKKAITNVVLIAIIIASLVSFAAVYIITYQQVKPLREMASAVSRFAGGDFSVRVPVTSETEVGQLAGAFNNMAASLASSEAMRRSFVANVSHELKTPMTSISGFVDGILDGTIPEQQRNHYLSIVSSETKRLSRLVRSMLDLSRIDSGDMKLNKSRFDLTKTVTSALLSFEQRIDEKQIDIQGLEHSRPLFVYGDPDLIHQVVYNLLDNAVKFTNKGGYISIRMYSRERSAYVRIANSGIGIPSEELQHVFERFYKTDKSRSHDKSGVGLGLFIVKTIISLHGGGIEARSTEGSYCEFEFNIPINARNQNEQPEEDK